MKKRLALIMATAAMLSMTNCVGVLAAESETVSEVEETDVENKITHKTVQIDSTTGEYKIPAVVTLPEGKENVPLVVICHGWAGNKDEGHGLGYIADRMAESGIASIRMDFIGTGDSEEDFIGFCNTTAINDVSDCLEYCLQNEPVNEEKLGIFGYSNGGRIAATITAKEDNPYKVRVLLAPGIYPSDGLDATLEDDIAECDKNGYIEKDWYGRTLKVGKQNYEDRLTFQENLDQYLVPGIDTLVIYGTEDTSVHTENSRKYAEEIEANSLVVQGADHGYGMYGTDEKSCEILDTVAGETAAYFGLRLNDDNAMSLFGEE